MEQRLLSDGQIRAGVTATDNSGNLDLPVQGVTELYFKIISLFIPKTHSKTRFCLYRPRVQTYQYQDVPGVKRIIGGNASPNASNRDNEETNVKKDAEWFV